jgi:hypothetical protein
VEEVLELPDRRVLAFELVEAFRDVARVGEPEEIREAQPPVAAADRGQQTRERGLVLRLVARAVLLLRAAGQRRLLGDLGEQSLEKALEELAQPGVEADEEDGTAFLDLGGRQERERQSEERLGLGESAAHETRLGRILEVELGRRVRHQLASG